MPLLQWGEVGASRTGKGGVWGHPWGGRCQQEACHAGSDIGQKTWHGATAPNPATPRGVGG